MSHHAHLQNKALNCPFLTFTIMSEPPHALFVQSCARSVLYKPHKSGKRKDVPEVAKNEFLSEGRNR